MAIITLKLELYHSTKGATEINFTINSHALGYN